MVVDTIHMTGHLRPLGALSGKISTAQGLHGSLAVGMGYATYSGEYEVTPQTYDEAELQTAGYLLEHNVKVQKIPQFAVSNAAGGATLIIGEEYFKHG